MRIRFRLLALILLAVVALDIPDAACDPMRIPGGHSIMSSMPGQEADPCAASCVPDCFCCSSTLPAVPVFAGQPLELFPGVPVIVLSRLTQGIPSVQDHVPRSTL